MSILFALALTTAPIAQPAPAAVADHSKHAEHQQNAEHQRHMQECKDMMAKMHEGMNHGDSAEGAGKAAAEQKDHTGH